MPRRFSHCARIKSQSQFPSKLEQRAESRRNWIGRCLISSDSLRARAKDRSTRCALIAERGASVDRSASRHCRCSRQTASSSSASISRSAARLSTSMGVSTISDATGLPFGSDVATSVVGSLTKGVGCIRTLDAVSASAVGCASFPETPTEGALSASHWCRWKRSPGSLPSSTGGTTSPESHTHRTLYSAPSTSRQSLGA